MPYLRTIIFCLLGLHWLCSTLWFGKSNVVDLITCAAPLTSWSDNLVLQERNNRLHADVNEIKNRVEAIEARAREQLGLIKPGETYYQVVLPDDNTPARDGN